MHPHFLILDLETTGLSPEKGDTIIDIGAIICSKDGIEKTFQSLVHPGNVEVPQFVHQLTGITQEMLADAPEKTQVLAQFRDFLGDEPYIVIGHNINFDTNFLNHHGFHFSESYNVDTNDFSTVFFPEIPSHSLEVLAATFGIEHTEKHRALGDVLACYELIKILFHRFHQLPTEKKDSIRSLLENSSWGGKHFFSLDIEAVAADFSYIPTEPESSDIKLEGKAALLEKALRTYLCSTSETTFFALPPFLPHAHMVVEACMSHTSTEPFLIIGTQQSIEAYKSLQSPDVLYLDKNKSLFSRIKLRNSAPNESSGEDMLLRIRDIVGQLNDDFISLHTLQLTYKERTYCQRFLLAKDDLQEQGAALKSFLSKQKVIIMTWYHFFQDVLSTPIQQFKKRILTGGMDIEYGIVESHKSFLSLDGLRYNMQHNMPEDIRQMYEGYVIIMGDLFERIQKKLRQMEVVQAELSLFTEEYKDFQVYTQRAIESMAELPTAPSLLSHFISYVRPFLDCTEGYYYYCKSYNNQITFFAEPKNITNLKEQLTKESQISIIDSIYDEDFPYFVNPTAYYTLEKEDLWDIVGKTMQLHLLEEKEDISSLEKADIEFFTHHVPKDKKSLILCNTGAKLEKLFDALINRHHEHSSHILAYGKSGGTHKVNHNIRGSKEVVVLAKFQDLPLIEPQAEITHIYFHSLPFPNIQGMYYDAHYSNTFASFTIPVTSKQLFEALMQCSTLGKEIHVYLYDSRIYTKDYGRQMLRSIQA